LRVDNNQRRRKRRIDEAFRLYAENDSDGNNSIADDGSIESLSETTEAILQTLIEPALAQNVGEGDDGQSTAIENDIDGNKNIVTDEGGIKNLSDTTEAILQTLIEPALASNVGEGDVDGLSLSSVDGMSDAVTLPDSDNMLSLASVEHDMCAETDDTCTTDVVHETIASDGVVTKSSSAPRGTALPTLQAPSVSRIVKFAVPAMGVWLCSPILSMIDTSAVGLLAGTAQQAALNPAVSVTDYGGLLVAFMYTASTNLIAGAREADNLEDGGLVDARPRTARTLLAALQLALYVGVGFGLVLGIFSQQLLRTLIGNTAAMDPAVFAAANRYVMIRSLGMPAAVVIGSAQSACLGMQDIKSPLYVLLVAALVNAMGDALFVGSKNIWIGGCSGAAWATVLSQYAALGLFIAWLKTKPRPKRSTDPNNIPAESIDQEVKMVDISNAILELTTKSEEGKSRRRRFRRTVRAINRGRLNLSSWTDRLNKKRNDAKSSRSSSGSSAPASRGVLANNQFRALDLFKLPPLAIAKEFWPFVIPVTTTAIGRISGYLAMSHVASSALGVVDMAAQAVIFSFFCCLTPICDSLNLTAQSFVPAIYEKKPSKARADALRQTLRNFAKVGGIFGALLVAMVATIPVLSQYFTADMAVRSAVNQAIPGLSLFFALSGLVCVGEGMLLGQKDLKFLGNAYGAYFFAVPYFLLRLKKRALMGLQDVGVGTMWQTFSFYQVIRCCIWFARMMQLQRRTDRQVAEEAEGGVLGAQLSAL